MYDLGLRALQEERRDKGHLLIMAITSDGFRLRFSGPAIDKATACWPASRSYCWLYRSGYGSLTGVTAGLSLHALDAKWLSSSSTFVSNAAVLFTKAARKAIAALTVSLDQVVEIPMLHPCLTMKTTGFVLHAGTNSSILQRRKRKPVFSILLHRRPPREMTKKRRCWQCWHGRPSAKAYWERYKWCYWYSSTLRGHYPSKG